MSSRHFGNPASNRLQRAVSVSVVAVLGTVLRERIDRGLRRADVVLDNAAETLSGCDILRSASKDNTPLAGRRVLVMVLGDDRGIILGLLGDADAALSADPVQENDPEAPRRNVVGSTDRVIEHAGSRIVLTADGDVVIQPARALRVEGSVVRVEGAGDASDNPVTLKPFLEWAERIETMLQRHESWIVGNAPFLRAGVTGPEAVVNPIIEASIPVAADAGIGASALKIPTGDT